MRTIKKDILQEVLLIKFVTHSSNFNYFKRRFTSKRRLKSSNQKIIMKQAAKFLMVILLMANFFSCTTEETEETTPSLKDIVLSNVPEIDHIELSWKPVEGVTWYQIYFAEEGKELEQITNYQNLIADPISYTLLDLAANTTYQIKIDGTVYASGGKVIASKTIKVTTKAQ